MKRNVIPVIALLIFIVSLLILRPLPYVDAHMHCPGGQKFCDYMVNQDGEIFAVYKFHVTRSSVEEN